MAKFRAKSAPVIRSDQCRPPLSAVHQGWHLYLVGEVLLYLRKQELFMAVALCLPLRRQVTDFFVSGRGLASSPEKHYPRPCTKQDESASFTSRRRHRISWSQPPSRARASAWSPRHRVRPGTERPRNKKETSLQSRALPHRFETSHQIPQSRMRFPLAIGPGVGSAFRVASGCQASAGKESSHRH